jgi:small subunit ribosomal protein S6
MPIKRAFFLFTFIRETGIIIRRVVKTAPCQKWPFRPEGGVRMKKYEVMYIINESVEAEKRAELIENLAKIITDNGGVVTKTDEWGMREFAYRIDYMKKGYYVVVNFEADNECVKEFDRLMRINANVVRFMITVDEAPVREAKK